MKKLINLLGYIFIFLTLLSNIYAISPDSDLLAWWTLAGTLTDSSGNGHTLSNSGATNTSNCGDQACYYFDGTGDSLTATGFISDSQTMTINAIVYKNASTTGTIIGKDNNLFATTSYNLLYLNTGSIFSYGGAGGDVTSSSTYSAMSWYVLTLTHNSSGTCLYVNGTLDTCASQTINENAETWVIGRSNPSGNNYNGFLKQVSIWNRSLNSSEVTDLVTNGIVPDSTPTLTTNQTNGTYYNYNPSILVYTTEGTDTNMTYTLNSGSEISLANNTNETSFIPSMVTGKNNFTFISRNGDSSSVNTSLTLYFDTTSPTITNNIPSESVSYLFNGSWFSCSDSNLDSCNISISSLNKASGTDFNLTFNGNLSYTITAIDLAGNIATESGYLYINPEFRVYFNNNTEYLTNFGINGTNYTNYFNGSIYDYGLGNHSFVFQKTGYEEYDFYLNFTNTSNINDTIYINPVFINIYLKDVDSGNEAQSGNYTILISNLQTGISKTYNIINNNFTSIVNNYATNTNLTISVVSNNTITNTLQLITPRENVTINIYINFQETEHRTFEVLTSTLSPIPNTYIYLYVYIENIGFVLQSIQSTNILGQASFPIIPLTKIYNICNTYGGEEVCLRQITFDNIATDPYQIIHSSSLNPVEVNYLQYITYSYLETKTNTTSQMSFTFNDANSIITSFCYNVTRYTNNSASHIGDYCQSGSSGTIVNTFGLTNDQRIKYDFYYVYSGVNTLLTSYTSYYINSDFNSFKDLGILDLLFLFILFGGIGLLLKFGNFDLYNIGFLSLLLIIFFIQGIITETYINIGLWSFLFIKTITVYLTRTEAS